MSLLSLVLTLQPLPASQAPANPLPTWWGRAAHALVLNVVAQFNPALAASLHDTPSSSETREVQSSMRPFTVSSLLGRFPGGALERAGRYTLRLTSFQKEVTDILLAAIQSTGPLYPGATIELDYLPFQVSALAPSPVPQSTIDNQKPQIENLKSQIENPWASLTTYQDLSAAYLLASQAPARQVGLQFTSPTTFKSGGMHVPIPLPELVFGSLLERWNAFAPIAFPPELRRYAAECLAVTRYKLSTRVVSMKGGGLRVGAVGEITYTTLNYDRYWMSLVHTLAAFTLFAGVGAGTSMGLGQCRENYASILRDSSELEVAH